jgi:chlorophyll/bacteriochlorophyll a synthase
MSVNVSTGPDIAAARLPQPRALLELIKPITWFPPMWAHLCGVISSGGDVAAQAGLVVLGIVLAGLRTIL